MVRKARLGADSLGPRTGPGGRHLYQSFQARQRHCGEELLAVTAVQSHRFTPHRAAGDEARRTPFVGGDLDDVGEVVKGHARGQDGPRPVQDLG